MERGRDGRARAELGYIGQPAASYLLQEVESCCPISGGEEAYDTGDDTTLVVPHVQELPQLQQRCQGR